MATLLAVQRRVGLPRGGRRGELVRYFGIAALAALVCAVMNIVELLGGGVVAAAVGNATNVFSPAMVWAGARRLNERPSIGAPAAAASALLMLAVTFVLALDAATLIKTGGIAVFCAIAAYELRRRHLRGVPGALPSALILAALAAFSLARIGIALTTGIGSWVWNTFASAQVTSIVSAVVILGMSVAVVPLGRALGADPEPGSREFEVRALRRHATRLFAEHSALVALTIEVPELNLIRAAHGKAPADEVVAALRRAVTEAFPHAAVGLLRRDTVAVILPADTERAGIDRVIHYRFSRLLKAAGSTDVPDLRVLHRGIADEARLAEFLRVTRVARSRAGARGEAGRVSR